MSRFSFELMLRRKICVIVVILFRFFFIQVNIVKHILSVRTSGRIFVISYEVQMTVALNYSILINLIYYLNLSLIKSLIVLEKIIL